MSIRFGHDLAKNLFSSNNTVCFQTSISAGDKMTASPPYDSVSLELTLSKEKHDIAEAWRFLNGLDVERVSILNRRQHAASASTKTKSISTRYELARELFKQSGM